ncbi:MULTISPECIES: type II toxin-antitoxin system HicA family toxin [Thermus]|uniref:Type II toxin-antitoxin system HicA family toxin n=2 Tax=Thermus TaxID=270 RepID=A0A4Y9EWC1_9DEIN|nr:MULTISPECIES: type II toxin-antitoxin system HicA family toxin [Thermus]TBH17249.1 type II toxin-antitoxin system HicA family toxin [Thermus thermamylovorans]TFU15425.1 type II toxin-antitoxin system HicA family toxin [Thermus tengchongensis]TFU25852.1 type II toxin-antitoxin system HicA family toxin [Thermus tengchongensis]
MRLPRDLEGEELAKRLSRLGYRVTRQTGSHLRLTWREGDREHHVTIPLHRPLKLGTLAGIVREIAQAHNLAREELLAILDL